MKIFIRKRKEVVLELSPVFESEFTIKEAELTRDLLTKMIRNAKAYQKYINASSTSAESEVIDNKCSKKNKKPMGK